MTEKILKKIEPFTEEPIRFIGSEGEPLFDFQPEDLGLTNEDLQKLFYYMKLTRAFDRKGMILTRQGKCRFYVEVAGQEAANIGSGYAVGPNDWVYTAHREHGVYIVRGYPLVEMFAQLMGRVEANKGKQMPVHWGLRKLRIITISSPVGTQLPQVTGVGMAINYLKKENEAIIGYIGDGGTAEGDFHVALTMAGVFRTPTVFFVQNNHWAISVPSERQYASKNIAVKAIAYGMDGYYVDGNDVLAVYAVTKHAFEKAYRKEPTLIEALTYRYGAHSTADDPSRYRDPKEVEEWKKKWDPIKRMRLYLERLGIWTEKWEEQMDEEIENLLNKAIEEADARPEPDPETMFEDVYAEMPWHLKEEYEEFLQELKERGIGK